LHPVIVPAATVDDVTSLAADVDVLHIAAHGRHSSDNPMFSGLELADGPLFGYDIDRMPRVPSTVVLSACEAGRSSVRWGEEAVGMARAWLHAGTRCVIAAPVVVADDDACELLGAMHEGLAAGQTPSEALAAASDRTGIVAPFQAHGSGF
jgi:CHAT domain-containing protein